MKKHDISDELLGAFVDDELACAESRGIAHTIKQDSELAEKASHLIDLKQSLKQAYPETLYSDTHTVLNKPQANSSFWPRSVAASVILGLGLFTGFLISENERTEISSYATGSQEELYGIKLAPVTQSQNRVLMHISTADFHKIEYLMQKVEQLLAEHRRTNTDFRLEVIANSDGIELLRKGSSPYEKQLVDLTRKYENLQLIACVNTLSRLRKEGKNIQVIHGVKTDAPALDTIINRMDRGWTYVKI